MLQRLRSESFDVVVVGGGITGVGVALDAASRGLRTALIERDDFSIGTSSKSSKLVHGGLRYLQDDPRLVYQALHERQRLRRNAPHLVKILPFMIPVLTSESVVSRKVARAMGTAMWLYDLTGGWRIGKFHKRLKKDRALPHMPTMPADKLAAAYLYYDATVDDARLVVTVARTAAQHGAVVVNRCSMVGLKHDESGRVVGIDVAADDMPAHNGNDGDHDRAQQFTVSTRVVVSATGVWGDDIRALDEGSHPDSIRPAKGVHITVPWDKVRNDIAVVIPVPGEKRNLFVVPWGANADGTFRHTYVGTTDSDYQGPLVDPACTKDDVDYVLNALNAAVTTNVTSADITGVWAGLRPLVKSAGSGKTADLSRRHKVRTSEHGVITIAGGKLTTFREMAEDTVDAVVDQLGGRQRCRTKKLGLLGATGFVEQTAGTVDQHLADRYGSMAGAVKTLAASQPDLAEPLIPGQPYLRAEAVYAVRHEMATTLDDVLTRRTRARLFDREATLAAASSAAELMAVELGWDEAETARQLADFAARCAAEARAEATSGAALMSEHPA
jgi:glycerol-3-phosphate dehydrogenase